MSLIEKRLEIYTQEKTDWRKQNWEHLLSFCKVKILNSFSNEFVDAYLLSESSLFVYDQKIILITCSEGNPLYLFQQDFLHSNQFLYHYEERNLEGVKNFLFAPSKTPRNLNLQSPNLEQIQKIFSGSIDEQRKNIFNFLKLEAFWPNYETQDYFFNPQGYSLNGLCGKNYLSIHWSFEENQNLLSIESSNH